MTSSHPRRFALVGCGAISELYYAPALVEVSKIIPLEMVALYDPSPDRTASLLRIFPNAKSVSNIEDLIATSPDLAVVASPAKFHSSQAIDLLSVGVHVLCEKPMASSVSEAESMIIAARRANCVLAIGLFRRFFPALQTIKDIIDKGSLGPVRHFHFEEGGLFNWPAASASFFQKNNSQGGVLLDLGVHLLDLICWWLGEPKSMLYEDDMIGNLEANCRLILAYENGITGDIRMSRDTSCSNTYTIEFERGRIAWKVGESNQLKLYLNDLPFDFHSQLCKDNLPASNYNQSFVRQILNFVSASMGLESVLVPGEEGIRSLKLIEQCYTDRTLMAMPWLTDLEIQGCSKLSAGES